MITPSPGILAITSLPVNRFPTTRTFNVPNNALRNPPFCYSSSFLIVSLTPFMSKSHPLRDLVIFIKSNLVTPGAKCFF